MVPEEDEQMPDGFDNPKLPRISLATDLPVTGVPAVAESDTVGLWGKGFDPDGPEAIVLFDGERIGDLRLKVADDGTIDATIRLPDDLDWGEHLVEVRQGDGRDARSTSSILLKVEVDNFEDEVESRFVDQGVGREHEANGDLAN
jgi:hypothetical protein